MLVLVAEQPLTELRLLSHPQVTTMHCMQFTEILQTVAGCKHSALNFKHAISDNS
jgi:hypothetical protein